MAFTDHVKVMMGADTQGVVKGLEKADKKLASFKKRLAGGLGMAAFAAAAKKSIDFGAAIGDLSDRLGVNAEFLQSVQHAAEQNGVSSDAAAIAMQRFTRRVAEAQANGGALATELENLGIKMRDSEGNARDTESMFKDFGAALTNIENPAEKLRVAFRFLDTEGAALTQMFQKGKPSLDEFGEQARQSGLILKNDTVKALQDASGELEKAQRSFSVLAAEVLPPLIKVLRTAKIGFDVLVLAFKHFPTTLEVVGKAILENIVDNFKRVGMEMKLLAAKLNNFQVKINPFADKADIDRAKQNMLDAQAEVEKARKMADLTLKQRQAQILALDSDLANKAKKIVKEKAQLQEKFNEIHGRGLKTTKAITDETKKTAAAVADINGLRTQEEITLTRTLDKIKALKAGGEEALKVVQDRHKMEDKIQRLMAQGGMNQQQATELAKKIIAAEAEELRLHEQIKREQEQKVQLKEQEADRKAIADQLKEEARLHAEARKEMNDELRILQLKAQGRDGEAKHMEKKLELERAAKDIAEQLGIKEKEAIGILEQKLGLEQKITQEKLNQQIDEIKDKNIEPGKDLREMGATERAKALRNMDRDEKKRARSQMEAARLEELLNDPEKVARMTDRERQTLEARLERRKNELLTPEQKKEIERIEKQKKVEKEAADKLKKELDDKQKAIKQEEEQKAKERKEAEEKAKEQLKELGDKIKDKMADALDAGEQAIKDAGTAIVNAINRLRGIQPVINVQGNATAKGGSSSGSGSGSGSGDLFDFENAQVNLGDLKEQLTAAVSNVGQAIAAEFAKMPKPELQIETPTDPETKNEIKIDLDGELQESTQLAILTALQGKMKNE